MPWFGKKTPPPQEDAKDKAPGSAGAEAGADKEGAGTTGKLQPSKPTGLTFVAEEVFQAVVDGVEDGESDWDTYVIWAPLPNLRTVGRPPTAKVPTEKHHTADHEDFVDHEREALRRRVMQTATYQQRCAARALLASALGANAEGEVEVLSGMLLPPPFRPPSPSTLIHHATPVTRDRLAQLVALLKLSADESVPAVSNPPAGEEKGPYQRPMSAEEGFALMREAIAVVAVNLAIQLGIGYAATHRTAARRVAGLLCVDFDEIVIAHERALCAAIVAAANKASAAGEADDKSLAKNKTSAKVKRGLAIGAFVVVGGALCVVTGGIAAAALGPAFVGLAGAVGSAAAVTSAGIGALLGTGALATALIGAVAVLGQAAIVCLLVAPVITSAALPTVFGASGATLAGYRMQNRLGDLTHFRLRALRAPTQSKHHGRITGDADDFEGHHRGVNRLISTVVGERRTRALPPIPAREIHVAHANLTDTVEHMSVMTVAVCNRIGETMRHAASRALLGKNERKGRADSDGLPPIHIEVVRRYTLTGTCHFAPPRLVDASAAAVALFHNRPQFPTGAEAVLVLRPLFTGKKTDSKKNAGPDGETTRMMPDEDIWLYCCVSITGSLTASVAAFPSALEAAGDELRSAKATDDVAPEAVPEAVAADAEDAKAADNADAENASATAPPVVADGEEPPKPTLTVSAQSNIKELRRKATASQTVFRNRQFAVKVMPGALMDCTVRLVADEHADELNTETDPGYTDLPDALSVAKQAMTSDAGKSARRRAALVLRFGADDESDGDDDDDAEDGAQQVASERSLLIDRIDILHGEPLKMPDTKRFGATRNARDLLDLPRRIPRRTASVLAFRNDKGLPLVPNVRGATMVVRAQHPKLAAEDKALYIVTAVTLTGSVETAVHFAAADLDPEAVVELGKLTAPPDSSDDRQVTSTMPVLDGADFESCRFSAHTVLDKKNDIITLTVADEASRRRRASRRRLGITVAVSGFTVLLDPGKSIAQQQAETWREALFTTPVARGTERHVLEWEPELLHTYGRFLEQRIGVERATEVGVNEATKAAKTAVLASVMAVAGAIAAPKMALQAIRMVDNSIATLTNRSHHAGEELALALTNDAVGRRPITLFGFGFGGAVVIQCAKHLARIGKAHCVEHLIVLGGQCFVSNKEWAMLRDCIPGRIVNVFTTGDVLLSTLSRLNSMGKAIGRIAGLNAAPVAGVENIDASSTVRDHTDYVHRLRAVLALIPNLPNLSTLRPRGFQSGRVVPRDEAAVAAREMCEDVTSSLPGVLKTIAAGFTRRDTAPVAVVVLDPADLGLRGTKEVGLELMDDRVVAGNKVWSYSPPQSAMGQCGIFAVRGSVTADEANDDEEDAATAVAATDDAVTRLAAYAVYRVRLVDSASESSDPIAVVIVAVAEHPAGKSEGGETAAGRIRVGCHVLPAAASVAFMRSMDPEQVLAMSADSTTAVDVQDAGAVAVRTLTGVDAARHLDGGRGKFKQSQAQGALHVVDFALPNQK